MAMKIGMCIGFEPTVEKTAQKLSRVMAFGYDYIEANVTGISKLEDAFVEALADACKEKQVRILAANCLFPATLRITGPEADAGAVRGYLESVFPKCQRLGIEKVVFGSGGARALPEGTSWEQGFEQLVCACRAAGEIGDKYGIMVVVEPLCPKDCNFINTVEEGLQVVRAVGLDNVRLLADLYHISENGEAIDLTNAASYLGHVHFAEPAGRSYAVELTSATQTFAKELKRIGYQDTVSVEAVLEDFETQPHKNAQIMGILFR